MSFAKNKTNRKLHIDVFNAILFWFPGTRTQARLGYQHSVDGLSKPLYVFQITMGSIKVLVFTLQKRKY